MRTLCFPMGLCFHGPWPPKPRLTQYGSGPCGVIDPRPVQAYRNGPSLLVRRRFINGRASPLNPIGWPRKDEYTVRRAHAGCQRSEIFSSAIPGTIMRGRRGSPGSWKRPDIHYRPSKAAVSRREKLPLIPASLFRRVFHRVPISPVRRVTTKDVTP